MDPEFRAVVLRGPLTNFLNENVQSPCEVLPEKKAFFSS